MIIDDALRFMGVAKPSSNDIENVKKALKEIEGAVLKNYIVIEKPISEIGNILIGKDIINHIDGCGSVFLFLATLGAGVDRLIKKAQIESMAHAVVVDAAASAFLEDYCDKICSELGKDKIITSRFSPGYGDLPIEIQPRLLSAVGAGKMGVTCAGGFMMIPTKSVSAIIGIRGDKR